MTPAELCKSGSEHGQQRALFAWANMAEQYGFEAAWDERSYAKAGMDVLKASVAEGEKHWAAVSELKWFHAIANGGSRGDDAKSRGIRGAMLKAEGVKRGIPDTFLPVPLWGIVGNVGSINGVPTAKSILYAGLYIEMKREASEGRRKGTTSDEQEEAIAWLRHSGYAVSVCFTWDAAAKELQSYIEATRKA